MTEYRLHGPPGTGKTRALATKWVPKAVEKFGPNRVVICSLTRTAAAEIATRDLPIPDQNVGTLHALAFRSLSRPKIAEGEIARWNEIESSFKLSGGKPSMDGPDMRSEKRGRGDELMALAQVYRHNRTPRSEWRHDVASFQRRWEDWMDSAGLVDFTGLMEKALDGVSYAPGNPDVFIVDEAQDCSVLELALVRKWNSQASYAVLAGDGDQAIYGWRGGSARAFLSPDIPKENNYHLTQSYRVPEAVHALASKWIDKASYRYAVDYEPRNEAGSLEYSQGNGRHVAPLLAEAVADLERGKSVMILATCSFMLRPAIAALRSAGVPFHNPHRSTHGAWNPLRGGAQRLLAYLRPDPNVYGDEARIWNWGEALRDEPRLTVGSIHSVKGAQADTVILLPDISPSGMKEWSKPGDAKDGIIRTFYVGMTRAKERLILGGRWSPYSVDWRS